MTRTEHLDPEVAALYAADDAKGEQRFLLEPNGDRILVRPDKAKTDYAGGAIVLLEAENLARGRVLASGPGVWQGDAFVEIPYNPGDLLLWGAYAGQKITLNGESLLVLRLADVIGLLMEVEDGS